MAGTEWTSGVAARMRVLCRETYPPVCHLCGKDISEDQYSVDHVIVHSKGGTNEIENLRPAHKSCNYSRQDKDVEAYRATIVDETGWFLNLG